VVVDSLTFGTGVSLEKLQSLRDPILQLRIQQETQQQGQLDAFVTAMQLAQVLFSGTSTDIGTQISNFFGSLNQLSTDPTNLSLRQGVLTAAGNLANAFHSAASNLTSQRNNLGPNVVQAVQQVNVLTSQIGQLNGQIANLQNLNQEASALVDKRDVLIGQLSSLIDVSAIKSDNGLTLTTSNGTALVAGEQSFPLTTQTDVSGVQHIFSLGSDITAKLTSGSLAGLLEVRDQKIPALLSNLDTLAAGLANALNTANQSGFDLNGTAGGNLFVPPPAGGQGAAASIAVQITGFLSRRADACGLCREHHRCRPSLCGGGRIGGGSDSEVGSGTRPAVDRLRQIIEGSGQRTADQDFVGRTGKGGHELVGRGAYLHGIGGGRLGRSTQGSAGSPAQVRPAADSVPVVTLIKLLLMAPESLRKICTGVAVNTCPPL
jgi:hypothetical protein